MGGKAGVYRELKGKKETRMYRELNGGEEKG